MVIVIAKTLPYQSLTRKLSKPDHIQLHHLRRPISRTQVRKFIWKTAKCTTTNPTVEYGTPKSSEWELYEHPAVPFHVKSSSHSQAPVQHKPTSHEVKEMKSRTSKKSNGPPKSLLSVFDSKIDHQTKKKHRKSFTAEGKKKVEAVRSIGACTQCRSRKRTVGIHWYFSWSITDEFIVWDYKAVPTMRSSSGKCATGLSYL